MVDKKEHGLYNKINIRPGGCGSRRKAVRMREETLLSVGVDVGTSTTQCVFSRLTLRNVAPAFSMPRVEIVDKTVLHRAPLHLTPLSGEHEIDADALLAMLRQDYQAAGMRPEDIRCGAVIITGETARRRNARAVTEALSSLAGDFVVAAAGPDLEAVLAGRGAGAAALSRARGERIVNLDIGGGTANMCLFDRGEPAETGNLDVGGRLLRFKKGSTAVLSYSDKLAAVAEDAGIPLKIGQTMTEEALLRLAERMAALLEEAVNLRQRSALYQQIVLEHGFSERMDARCFTFSGGVGDCVYGAPDAGLEFDDLGSRLGEALRRSRFFTMGRVLRPAETQQATVIGAGAYSMTVSGSTVLYANARFPLRALPVGRIRFETPDDIPRLAERAAAQRVLLGGDCAIGFSGLETPGFSQIEAAAEQLSGLCARESTLVLVMEHDMAKALGQAIRRRAPDAPLVCLDGVALRTGDVLDIGAPVSDGRAVPMLVRTLVFSNS